MKVLHAPAWYPPASIGGTEIYVAGLVSELRVRDVQCVIALPRRVGAPERYLHEDVEVRTYPVNETPSRREVRGLDPPHGMDEFRRILGGGFDVYHQHAMSRGCGLPHLAAARRAGLPTVLTVHTPNATCLRGTMMRQGRVACDGRIDARQCSPCWASERGASDALASVAASMPGPVASVAAGLTGAGAPAILARAFTLLSANELVAAKARDLAAISETADVVIAVCEWLERALAVNGLSKDRLMLSRQGIDTFLASKLTALRSSRTLPATGPTTFGLIGRWHKTKGIDLAIRAFKKLGRERDVRLDIYATAQGLEGEAHREQCLALIDGDERISVRPAFDRPDLPSVLSSLDALLVPSRWMETGPLVALEALAAGVWVIGSDIGGLPELVTEGQTGSLVPAEDEASWTEAMGGFVRNPQRPKQVAPRTMSDVALDMVGVYAQLVGRRATAIPAAT